MRDLYSQAIHCNQVRHELRRNPPENWVILIFSGSHREFSLENVKKNTVCFKLFWYKVFVHWKLKLLKVYTWNVSENIWVFLVVEETIAGSSLCGSVSFVQCLFNLLYYVIWWWRPSTTPRNYQNISKSGNIFLS